jgi:hypothetical protein
MSDPRFPELDALTTEELRVRAFASARRGGDLRFFWNLFRHLPHADDAEGLDNSTGAFGATVDDAVALWREFTKHEYGDQEPLIRASFVEYLLEHEKPAT